MARLLQFAQKGIVEKGNKVLVLRNPKNARHNPGMVHFPGGRMEFGEGVDEHIVREILEETAVVVEPLEPVAVTSWMVKVGESDRESLRKDELQIVALIRRCKYVSGNPNFRNNVDDEAIASVYWVDPKSLVNDPDFDKKLLPSLKEYFRRFL